MNLVEEERKERWRKSRAWQEFQMLSESDQNKYFSEATKRISDRWTREPDFAEAWTNADTKTQDEFLQMLATAFYIKAREL